MHKFATRRDGRSKHLTSKPERSHSTLFNICQPIMMRNGEENVKVHIHKSKSSMRLQNYPSLIFFQLVSAWMMTLDVIVCHWSSWSSLSFELSLPTSFTTFTDLFFFHSSFGAALSSYFLGLFAIVITHRILDYGSCPSNFILVLSFIVLFSYVIASQHRSQHQGNYLHCILFWRSDYCPSNCFHVPHSLQFFVPFLSLPLFSHPQSSLDPHQILVQEIRSFFSVCPVLVR